MAQIRIAEIPNAPQEVFTPLAQANFAGDQIGNEVKNDINRGLEGLKVNPLAAAVGGEMIMKGATDIQKAGMAIAEGNSRLQMKKNQEDYASGQIKFYQNQIALGQAFSDASRGQPVEQFPVIYNQVYGKDGANYYAGMTDREKLFQQPDVMHNFAKGMAEQVNTVGTFHLQQQQTNALVNWQDALNRGSVADMIAINKTMGATGWFPPHVMAQHDEIIKNKNDVFNVQSIILAKPLDNDWDKQLTKSLSSGQPIKDAPFLTDPDKRNLLTLRQAAKTDAQYEISNSMMRRLDNQEITDARVLLNDEGVKKLEPDQQKALVARMNNRNVGTPIGIAYTLKAQQALDMYPQATTPEGRIKELDDISTLITATVPGEQGQIQQEQLQSIRKEMATNGGMRSQDAIVKQYYSKKLEIAADAGAFGTVPTADQLKTPAGAEMMLAIEQRKADIKVLLSKGYKGKPITTISEANAALQEYMHGEEAAKITPSRQEGLGDLFKRLLRDGQMQTNSEL